MKVLYWLYLLTMGLLLFGTGSTILGFSLF